MAEHSAFEAAAVLELTHVGAQHYSVTCPVTFGLGAFGSYSMVSTTVAALGALNVSDGSEGPRVTSAPAAATDAPPAQPDLEGMEEGERPDPAPSSSTDRELSLLLQNLHRAIDATSKGAPFPVSSAVHTTLPLGGGVPGVTSPVSDPAVKFDKWLNRARLDKPKKFDGESGEGGDCV